MGENVGDRSKGDGRSGGGGSNGGVWNPEETVCCEDEEAGF